MPRERIARAKDTLIFVLAFSGALLCILLLCVYIIPISGSSEGGEALLMLMLYTFLLAWLFQAAFSAVALNPMLNSLHKGKPGQAAFIFLLLAALLVMVEYSLEYVMPDIAFAGVTPLQLRQMQRSLGIGLRLTLFALGISAIVDVLPGVLLIALSALAIPLATTFFLNYLWQTPLVIATILGMIACFAITALALLINLRRFFTKQAFIVESIHYNLVAIKQSAQRCRLRLKGSRNSFNLRINEYKGSRATI